MYISRLYYERDAAYLSLIDSFLQDAPQLLLQSYILLSRDSQVETWFIISPGVPEPNKIQGVQENMKHYFYASCYFTSSYIAWFTGAQENLTCFTQIVFGWIEKLAVSLFLDPPYLSRGRARLDYYTSEYSSRTITILFRNYLTLWQLWHRLDQSSSPSAPSPSV